MSRVGERHQAFLPSAGEESCCTLSPLDVAAPRVTPMHIFVESVRVQVRVKHLWRPGVVTTELGDGLFVVTLATSQKECVTGDVRPLPLVVELDSGEEPIELD